MDYYNQESDRLLYRSLTKEDIPSWVEFFINNDRLKFLGMDLQKSNETLAEEWITKQLSRYNELGLGHLAIILKDSGELIGMGGIIPRELSEGKEYEIGYSIKPKYWGKGYATEIAVTMKSFGFNNIETNRLISIIDIENTDSAKVATKNGMNVLFKTEFMGMNVDVFGITKADYKQGNI